MGARNRANNKTFRLASTEAAGVHVKVLFLQGKSF